jgi:hypothetical protein
MKWRSDRDMHAFWVWPTCNEGRPRFFLNPLPLQQDAATAIELQYAPNMIYAEFDGTQILAVSIEGTGQQ